MSLTGEMSSVWQASFWGTNIPEACALSALRIQLMPFGVLYRLNHCLLFGLDRSSPSLSAA